MAKPYFKPGVVKPTIVFESILDKIEAHGIAAPTAAAGILAHFVDGEDFDSFIQCLCEDGLTREGLVALAKAALDGIEDCDD